jgi:hypothetical protein
MTIPLRSGNPVGVQPVRDAVLRDYLLPMTEAPNVRPEFSTSEIAFRIFAALRAHPHISNVLTHISRANWIEVERSLNRILDMSTTSDGLSSLEENIIDLMVGERGVTGRILKPYFQAALHRLVEPSRAERLIRHVNALYLELEWKVQHSAHAQLRSEPLEEQGHVRAGPQ